MKEYTGEGLRTKKKNTSEDISSPKANGLTVRTRE